MNVSSVKNLNGETFSAVQDLSLTNVVQTNSAVLTGMIDAKQDTLTFGYDEQDRINSINNSALAGGGAVSANSPLSGDGSNSQPLGIEAQYLSAWGTETMPISACDGVKLVPADGIIYAKLDETVLYTATAASNTITLSEKCTNFERLRLELKSYQSPTVINYTEVKPADTTLTFFAQTLIPAATYPLQILGVQFTGTNGITYNMNKGVRFFYKNNDHGGNESNDMTSNIKDAGFITKIVGINRVSGSV